MKRLKLTKIIAGSLIALSVLALNPIGASAQWKQDSKGWWDSEGSSWSKGWKDINGKWYYFDYDTGYMKHDEIVEGYYVDSNGVYVNNPSEEIKEYAKIIKSDDWYDRITNGMKWQRGFTANSMIEVNAPLRGIVMDFNNDGTKEMIVTNESQNSISVVTYNKGNINVLKSIDVTYAEYSGYSKSENVFFVYGYFQGSNEIKGYKVDNNELKEVYFYYDSTKDHTGGPHKGYFISEEDYTNNKSVSKDEYYNALEKLYEKLDSEGQNKVGPLLEDLGK
ncbi:hypothetical protein CBE01nite_22700 [Clostridium beijerinckii]|uniref:Cell wall-binding protein n=1 Tax=Clostridium beijerinckii TaxID=1520 RepID=A0AB74VAK3_CLOBE|nr:hypothetical protein [Clostridium beijerinckii]NRZ27696.1 hypothetical protein [Clostridium beijerinckii]NYB96520.1 hypothetical protein [Clostridium beijerinckii]OOM25050.1 hypothetical protein CLBEI_17340 [Clostridium beijerinckii]QUN33492.1 hypothetical protein KEC93_16130 [Clostridium beijerinckii]SQB01277.1 cell wall binding repeat-containing protein [Clostridium beijerinckii]